MYSKGGGKAGAHSWVSSAESIGSLSYIVVQLFEPAYRRLFQSIHQKYSSMAVSRFAHLPSNSFLVTVAEDAVKTTKDQLEISLPALTVFKELSDEKEKLVEAVARLNTVRGRGNIVEMEEEEEEDD